MITKQCNQCGEVKQLQSFERPLESRAVCQATVRHARESRMLSTSKQGTKRKLRETRSKWVKSQRQKRQAYQKSWREKNPDKYRAHMRLQSLLRNGTIVKANACEYCHSEGVRLEGAHGDYSKPEKVLWLCVPCHRRMDDNPVAMGRLATPEDRQVG